MMLRSTIVTVAIAGIAAGCGGAPEKKGPASAGDLALEEADAGVAPDAGEEPPDTGPEQPVAEPAEDLGEVLLTVDVIDVGTGLSVFLRGADFTMLFDAGSKEDVAQNKGNRVVAFLKERHPDVKVIDYIVLSHAHRDHVNLMPDVLEQYEVHEIWEPGVVISTCPYRDFVEAVAAEEGVVYHTGVNRKGRHTIKFDSMKCRGSKQRQMEETEFEIEHGSKLKAGQVVKLGEGVQMTFLYVYLKGREYQNKNSLIVRIDAGPRKIILAGDTVAGRRGDPSVPPDEDSAEGRLVECCADDLAADVLQVGHHGAGNASSAMFLDAVGAEIFVMPAGQASFHDYVVPFPGVVEELERRGQLWRSDARDDVCAESTLKVGPKADGMYGGCDNIRITVFEDADAPLKVEVYPEEL